ncbi:alpha/beta hydrolase [Aquihabitans sp. G128]|uniref:alpha/beta fold hydrolase n=1 Tax=Aquihabitans sp. G128 TaxID=2849779 RepID=UPI001C23FF37|nr:alpha/beta hydrolase [Aquihabitans sp. G128]QXC60347.1 alpha/beta hydrolase [Aquihabitans sp. G128]
MGQAEVITLTDGRTLGFDDVGDPMGSAVLYVHGSPDSRRARHPDDDLAARLGVRLVAVDRPGAGLSSPHPDGTVGSFADDAIALADHLGVHRWLPFAWSAGSVYALAVAARHPERVARVAVAAGLVPFAAYATPGILDDADGGRWMVAELGEELGAAGLAEAAAPMLAPYPCDVALAREHVLEQADPVRRRELEAIPGAVDALAAGVADSVAHGLGGLVRDLELQVEAPDVSWDDVAAPVDLWYGQRDATAPPAFGTWWAEHLRWGELTVVPDAGHLVALSHWEPILARLLT